jgi:hypothetical protein
VYEGDTVQFSLVKNGNVWNTSLRRNGGAAVTGSFNLGILLSILPFYYRELFESVLTLPGSKTMNQVLMAIELTGVSWDFGPLEFDNVVIVTPLPTLIIDFLHER